MHTLKPIIVVGVAQRKIMENSLGGGGLSNEYARDVDRISMDSNSLLVPNHRCVRINSRKCSSCRIIWDPVQ